MGGPHSRRGACRADDPVPITALSVADDGIVWVGASRWVSRYDGQHWTSYDSGLDPNSDDLVHTVDGVDVGGVWVGTDRDLAFLEPDADDELSAGRKP